MTEPLNATDLTDEIMQRFFKQCRIVSAGCVLFAPDDFHFFVNTRFGKRSPRSIAYLWANGIAVNDEYLRTLAVTCGSARCVSPLHITQRNELKVRQLRARRQMDADINLCARGHDLSRDDSWVRVGLHMRCRGCVDSGYEIGERIGRR